MSLPPTPARIDYASQAAYELAWRAWRDKVAALLTQDPAAVHVAAVIAAQPDPMQPAVDAVEAWLKAQTGRP